MHEIHSDTHAFVVIAQELHVLNILKFIMLLQISRPWGTGVTIIMIVNIGDTIYREITGIAQL